MKQVAKINRALYCKRSQLVVETLNLQRPTPRFIKLVTKISTTSENKSKMNLHGYTIKGKTFKQMKKIWNFTVKF